MSFPPHKTKIGCTIGPASRSPAVMEQMLDAGMSVARLHLSHGDFAIHKAVIKNLHAAARANGKRVTIMAALPGPKMRLGSFSREPIILKASDALLRNDGIIRLEVTRVVDSDVHCRVIVGGAMRSRKELIENSLSKETGDTSRALILLAVQRDRCPITYADLNNLPRIDLAINVFTDRAQEGLCFALEEENGCHYHNQV